VVIERYALPHQRLGEPLPEELNEIVDRSYLATGAAIVRSPHAAPHELFMTLQV
jgi:hypothetical protein